MTRPPLHALTSMRFVAAILVVVYHVAATAPVLAKAPGVVRNVIQAGYVWVGFFFVLSGFILTYQYLDRMRAGAFSAREFWVARFARIYPGYLIGFLAVVCLIFVEPWVGAYPDGGAPVIAADVAATLAMAHAWIPSFALTFNYPAWSLSVEAFFYLCFPLLIGCAARLPLRACLALAAAVYLAAVAGNLLYCAADPHGWAANDFAHDAGRNFIKFFPLVRLPEFLVGVALALVYDARAQLGIGEGWGRLLTGAGLALIALGLAASASIPYVLLHNVVLVLPFAALVLGLALAPSSLPGKILSSRAAVALGEASYSVYILQVPVLWFFFRHYDWVVSMDAGFAVAARAGVLLAVVALGLLSHRFLEAPARRWIRATWGRS